MEVLPVQSQQSFGHPWPFDCYPQLLGQQQWSHWKSEMETALEDELALLKKMAAPSSTDEVTSPITTLLLDLAGVEHVMEDLVDRLDDHEQEEYDAGVDEPDIPDKCCEILNMETSPSVL